MTFTLHIHRNHASSEFPRRLTDFLHCGQAIITFEAEARTGTGFKASGDISVISLQEVTVVSFPCLGLGQSLI